jgi:hypothetical protein
MALIKYNGETLTEIFEGQKVVLHTNGHDLDGDIEINGVGGGGTDSPLPIEISSESAMNALLATAAVGSVYKYRGTSGTYENGALYIVEAVS